MEGITVQSGFSLFQKQAPVNLRAPRTTEAAFGVKGNRHSILSWQGLRHALIYVHCSNAKKRCARRMARFSIGCRNLLSGFDRRTQDHSWIIRRSIERLKKGIAGQLGRARIVITTRPIPFDEQLVRHLLPVPETRETEANSDTFAQIAMGRRVEIQAEEKEEALDWRTVALMPLSDAQITDFALGQGVNDPAAMQADSKRRNAEEFARTARLDRTLRGLA
ncbi:MAG: hypothetical protein R2843_15075 [Thermomicrobiales bacterium]